MKKLLAAILVILFIVSAAACSAISNNTEDNIAPGEAELNMSSSFGGGKSDYAYSDDADYEIYDEAPMAAMPMPKDGGGAASGSGLSAHITESSPLSEKIIYTANASVESITFDDSVKTLGEMITQYGAFIESSSETGADYASTYYGYNPYRTANYTIRVPRESFNAFTSGLSSLGSVTSLTTNAENVTEQYTDIEARLTAYRTQEESLLAMLAKAETVEDMITIESKLSEVRYMIESLTSNLRNIDSKVSYSSVSIYLREVEELRKVEPIFRSYWQQIGDGFKATLASVGNFFKSLFKWLIVNLPVLVLLAVIVVVIIVLVRRYMRRQKHAVKAINPTNEKTITTEENKDE